VDLFTTSTLSLSAMFVLFLTAILAGLFNAIAGGGSFLTFPMLIVLGFPAVEANATSTIGLWFGVIASAYTYRQYLGGEQSEIGKSPFWSLTLISLIGGTIGSLLLLRLPARTFTQLVPYLMLIAVSLFTANPWLMAWLKAQGKTTHLPLAGALLLQFGIAIYGGYFGGGASILMLAVMSFMGFSNWNVMNGMKGWLGAVFNSIAIGLFIQAGKIIWLPGAVIAIGSSIGAYGGATIVQKIPTKYLQWVVVGIGWAMTVYLFWKNRH
jgi:uncharacterized protein